MICLHSMEYLLIWELVSWCICCSCIRSIIQIKWKYEWMNERANERTNQWVLCYTLLSKSLAKCTPTDFQSPITSNCFSIANVLFGLDNRTDIVSFICTCIYFTRSPTKTAHYVKLWLEHTIYAIIHIDRDILAIVRETLRFFFSIHSSYIASFI